MATRRPKESLFLLYLHFGVVGRQILSSKDPHIMIDTLTTEFRKIIEDAFVRPRIITFHRQVFLITKQLRGETV